MRVAVIAGYLASLRNFRGHLLRAMLDAGHEVHALSPPGDAETTAWLADTGITLHHYPLSRRGLSPFTDGRTLLALFSRLRAIRPDVALSYTIKPVIYGSLAARLARVPRVFSIITGLGYAFGPADAPTEAVPRRLKALYATVKGLYRTALARNEAVFFQNPDDERFFIKYGLADPARTLVTNGSGVDLEHFAPRPLPEAPGFCCVTRLLAQKGVAEYAEAARRIRADHPDAACVLVGPFEPGGGGITEADLARFKDEGSIDYVGRTDDVRPYLAACSAYVLPSYYREGTPRSILEAMSTGRAVVTTDAPGCRETVDEGVNGFLVPPRDADALEAAMRRLLDMDLARRMGAESRRIADERYDVHKVNRMMLERMGLA